jgi:hypothetical protein
MYPGGALALFPARAAHQRPRRDRESVMGTSTSRRGRDVDVLTLAIRLLREA